MSHLCHVRVDTAARTQEGLQARCGRFILTCILQTLFLLMCVGSHSFAADGQGMAAPDDHTIDFNIPQQPLPSALHAFAGRTGWEVSSAADLPEGRTSPGVQGMLTPEEGLKVLLAGTGLTYRLIGPRTITIERISSAPMLPSAIDSTSIARQDQPDPESEKPVKVAEIVIKDVRQRDQDTMSYVAEKANTATRTDTPLIQVPQSVEVVTQKVIEDQRAVRVEQALRNVSGVALGDVGQSGIAADVAYCRGFPCGYFKNYLRNEDQNQSLTFRDISNIQRLEVLKGPASVLYGRSQPGGIINILTKQPQAERYASIDQIIGNYNYYRTMIDVTGPLNESKTLLFRINGAYENTESFRDVVRGQRYFVSPVFTWLAGNNTTITVEGEYIRDRRTPDFGIPAIGRGLASLPDSRFLGERFDTMAFEEARAGLTVEHRFNSHWRIESRFRMDRSTATAYRTVAAGLLADNQTMARFLFDQLAPVSSYYWRNDVIGKFSTGSIGHNLLAGAEIGRQYASYDQAAALSSAINIFNPVYDAPVPVLNRTPSQP
ncbi:MAG: TonB-dependent receptor [Nitrospira sp.]